MGYTENYSLLRKKIGLYFDNELNGDECASLMEKVNQDSKCGSMFNKEKNFRDYIKNNIKRPCVSPECLQKIKNNVIVGD